MRITLLAAATVFGLFAGTALADDGAPPPPPPTVEPPPPTEAPTIAPSDAEKRRVIEMAPPEGTSSAPITMAPAPCPPANCGPQPCFQKRDDCGWPVDACGTLYGQVDITLEGMASWFSSPDGPLGEIVAGNTDPLEWNKIDYPAEWGGRGTFSYRYDAPSRIELRGTYWGNPDDSSNEAGFFGATPGALGIGDLSRPVDATMSSEAEMWGIELNWWTEVSCSGRVRFDAGVGLRYVSLTETAHVDFVTTGPGPFPITDGFVDSSVTNDFFGGQLMVAGHVDASEKFELYGSLKGLFGQVTRDIDVSDDSIFAGGPHSAHSEDNEFVFGVDFELGLKWRLSSRLAITAGYELFMLDNVQRAEDAMDFSHSNTGAVQARQVPDQIVAHSVFLGISINF